MIRTILFNLVYYVGTLTIGIVIVPSLLLPDKIYWPFIRLYFRWVHLIERYILGLDYIVVGRENLPVDTPYIIAMKHQSAYETLKLPILFDRPTVILKRELLMIPFWGWYARKSGMIGIDRGNARAALTQMVDGVKRAIAGGSTPVIFPQGTRVATTDTASDKPYKRGIAHIYVDAGVAVVPVALNSGLFWARNAWVKKPGLVTFQFLPAIPPGLDETAFMTRLETATETTSNTLGTNPAPFKKSKFFPVFMGILATITIIAYTVLWHWGAKVFQQQLNDVWVNAPVNGAILSPPAPRVSGFPGKYKITWAGNIRTVDAEITLPELTITFFPVPYTQMHIDLPDGVWIEHLDTQIQGAENGLKFTHIAATIEIPRYLPEAWIKPEVQKLHDMGIVYRLKNLSVTGPVLGDFTPTLTAQGQISYDADLQPTGTMAATFSDPDKIAALIGGMIQSPLGKSFATGAIKSLSVTDPVTGVQTLPLTFKMQNGSVYAGPVKIGSTGTYYWPVEAPPSN